MQQRVLFVDHADVLGGAEHSLLLLLKHLDREKIDPILACPQGQLATAARTRAIRVEHIELPRLRKSLAAPWHLLHGAVQLAHLVRECNCTHLCSNTMRASIYASLAAKLCGRPMIWYVRDVFQNGWYVTSLSRYAETIIAVSNAAANPIRAQTNHVNVIPNGIELDSFARNSRSSLRCSWGIPETAHVVGIVGRVRSTKGHHHFLQALADVCHNHPNIWGVIIGETLFSGEDGYIQSLEKQSKQLGISDRIVFAGYTDDVPQVMQSLDVLVSCSIVPESFGRTIIEAMACGVPVISYDHGGPSEIIHNGQDGYLIKSGDIDALGLAIDRLLSNPEVYAQMRHKALETAHRYDIKKLTQQAESAILASSYQTGSR